MSAARNTSYGSYSKPNNRAPQTYGQLQDHVFAQRAQRALDVQAQRRVETADDLATILQEFASDGTVLKTLRDFDMPIHRRQQAAFVTPRATQAAEKLKIKDDSNAFPWTIRLASPEAARIAEAFSKFLQQDGLILRVAAMSTRQILSLCLLHHRLSWQKDKALQFREALLSLLALLACVCVCVFVCVCAEHVLFLHPFPSIAHFA